MAKQEIIFAGSTIGEPWWNLGEIVAKVLEPRGYKVTVTDQSASFANLRWVESDKADLGPQTPVILNYALKSMGPYKGEEFPDLTSIATIQWPCWLAIAIRRDIGCVDLVDAKNKKYPLRILANNAETLETVLKHYGMSIKGVESWGGKYTPMKDRAGYWRSGLGDMFIGHIYIGFTPVTYAWQEATILYDMRFLDLDGGLIKKFEKNPGYKQSLMPHGLYRGVDRDVKTVGQSEMYILCRANQSKKLARDVAEGLDENPDLFLKTRSIFSYDRSKAWKNPFIPLHSGAEEYYQEKGYMKP